MEKIKKLNLKGHLLTAISYLIPIVCGAGFLIAIGMAFGGTSQGTLVQGKFSFFDALATMGGAGLGLLPVVIATGISYSIAAKPGIAPGFIIGLTANAIGAGFIGGDIRWLSFWIPRVSYFKPCESPKLGKRTDANIDYSICCFYPRWVNHGLYHWNTCCLVYVFSYEFLRWIR